VKHRLLWILLALSVLWVSLTGHPQATWMEWYGHEDDVHVGGVLDMGDEYWLYGTSFAAADPGDSGIVLFRVQTDGRLIAPVAYDWEGVQSAADGMVDGEGNIHLAGGTTAYGSGGSDMYVLKLDSYGQTLAEWTYGSQLDESAVRIFAGESGDPYIVGNQTNPEDPIADADTPGYGGFDARSGPIVARIEPNGASVWTRDFRTTANEVVVDAAPASNGDCYLLVTDYGFPNAEDVLRLYRVADHGGMSWSRTFAAAESRGESILTLPSGWMVLAGSQRSEAGGDLEGWLMLLMGAGREIWSRTYGDPEAPTTFQALTGTARGHVVAAGIRQDAGVDGDEIYLVCVDFDGELLWERTIDTGRSITVEGLLELRDGGFLIAGAGLSDEGIDQAMLVRVDP